MSNRAIIVAIAAVVAVAIGGYVMMLSRPPLTPEEVAAAREELRQHRQYLSDVPCERPPLFGSATDAALPLHELLSSEGPFARCIDAARGIEPNYVTLDTDGSDLGDLSIRDGFRIFDIPEEVSVHCAGLPAELELQARASNHCAPRPDSDAWRHALVVGGSALTGPIYLARAAIALAMTSAKDDVDGALRLLVSCLATLGDLQRGPVTSDMVLAVQDATDSVVQAFQWVLMEGSPTQENEEQVRAALDHAMVSVDVHRMVVADGVRASDEVRAQLAGDVDVDEVRDYVSFELLSATTQACPEGITAGECAEALRFPAPSAAKWYEVLRTPRAELERGIAQLLEGVSMGQRAAARRIAEAEGDRETLVQLLRWAGARRDGRCPAPEADLGTLTHAADGEGGYLIVGPGSADRLALRFTCPIDESWVSEPPPPPSTGRRRHSR